MNTSCVAISDHATQQHAGGDRAHSAKHGNRPAQQEGSIINLSCGIKLGVKVNANHHREGQEHTCARPPGARTDSTYNQQNAHKVSEYERKRERRRAQ
jgi:hypothetical protein